MKDKIHKLRSCPDTFNFPHKFEAVSLFDHPQHIPKDAVRVFRQIDTFDTALFCKLSNVFRADLLISKVLPCIQRHGIKLGCRAKAVSMAKPIQVVCPITDNLDSLGLNFILLNPFPKKRLIVLSRAAELHNTVRPDPHASIGECSWASRILLTALVSIFHSLAVQDQVSRTNVVVMLHLSPPD